jgi:hypothetical protein
MPYVARNKSGAIIAVFKDKNECARERVSPDDRELRSFLGQNNLPKRAHIQAVERVRLQQALRKSDADFVSVLDDLIIALQEKEVIVFTDLPAEAGRKLMDRQQNRGEPAGSIGLAAREQLA